MLLELLCMRMRTGSWRFSDSGAPLHAPQARAALPSPVYTFETLHLKRGSQCLCFLKGNPGHWGKGSQPGGLFPATRQTWRPQEEVTECDAQAASYCLHGCPQASLDHQADTYKGGQQAPWNQEALIHCYSQLTKGDSRKKPNQGRASGQ